MFSFLMVFLNRDPGVNSEVLANLIPLSETTILVVIDARYGKILQQLQKDLNQNVDKALFYKALKITFHVSC